MADPKRFPSPWRSPSYWLSYPYRSPFSKQWCGLRARLSSSLYHHPIAIPAGLLCAGMLSSALFVANFAGKSPDHEVQLTATQQMRSENDIARLSAQEEQLRQLSIQLSNLQARADRLDQLGQEWVDEAGLEEKGFNFGEAPPRGGPEEGDDMFEPLSMEDLARDTLALAHHYDQLEAQLQILGNYTALDQKIPTTMPHAYPGGRYQTSSFGSRYDPFGRGRRFHSGIDLAAKVGDPVMAMAAGKVIFSGWQGGYGNLVEIDHENGYRTRYAHNSRLTVRVGQRVEVGQVLARAGSTGRSTGAHLHVEVWQGNRAVDPRPFIEQGRRKMAEQDKVLAQLALVPNAAERNRQEEG